MRNLKIIFMGTPDFAIPSLDILIRNGFQIKAVVTAPDKPKGRGQKLTPSPIKAYAEESQIPVLQPKNLKSPDFIQQLKDLEVNLLVVVAFRMLPEAVWSLPAYGTFNLHASLLPQYRGAAPINWALINGEKETGVTTFMIKHEIDTGSIIFQEKVPIHESDNAGALHDRLMEAGAGLVLKTVQAIQKEDLNLQPQVEMADLKKAPKLDRETCQIDWNQPGLDIYNFIRGLSPYPAAWTMLDDKILKIYKTSYEKSEHIEQPGKLTTDGKKQLRFASRDGWIDVHEVQMQGKKRMSTGEFLRGYQI